MPRPFPSMGIAVNSRHGLCLILLLIKNQTFRAGALALAKFQYSSDENKALMEIFAIATGYDEKSNFRQLEPIIITARALTLLAAKTVKH